jgi:hypothetical protein
MNNVRLVCGGVSVDLPSDFGILINKSIADIREPESRSSDWSKTFTLPGTKANNKLFTHLFDLNLSIRNTSATNFNPDFNPNLKADAILQVDEVTQIQGFIRLLGIKVNDLNQIEYECSMHGELADLFAKIADEKLINLDFSEYNHIISDTNIFNSWDTSIIKNGSAFVNFSGNAPIGDGYVYTWMDDGTYADYKNLNTEDMTICLYAKTVVDKIFSGAGYSYTSGSFFNTPEFKRMVIPCPTRYPILTQDAVADRTIDVKRSSDIVVLPLDKIIFNAENSDPSNQYNTTTGVYTNDYSGIYDLFFVNKATVSGLTNGDAYGSIYELKINGNAARILYSESKIASAGSVTFDSILPVNFIYLNSGDTVELELQYVYNYTTNTFPALTYTYTQKTNSRFFNQIYDMGWGYNKPLDFAGFFTGDTKQREFLKWLFTMFNLYIEPTDIDKTLTILPREEFYTNTVRDWTQKRDISQPLEIVPMGELDASKYLFTYAEGDDDDNNAYKQEFDRIYGDRTIVINNDFIKDEKKIEIGFQPTLIVKPVNEPDKYFAGNSTDNKDGKAGKLRILQYAKQNCISYTIYLGAKTSASTPSTTTKTIYPYIGHFDTPLTSTYDINFGMPKYIGLPARTPITNNNLTNQYWSKYLQEITDKDSKIVKGKFYLTPGDMEKLSFRDLYFFDNNYFRLNKIEDYDPINPSVNICEFLFLKAGPTFTATTGSVSGGGKNGNIFSGQEEYDPYDGANNQGKVIRDKGIALGQFNQAGDGIVAGDAVSNYGRANAAFATSGTSFLPGSERSIVIGEGVQNVQSDEIWLQGHLMTQENFSTNRIQLTAATTVTADLYKDIYIMDCTANTTLNLPDATTCISKAYYVYKNTSAHQLRIEPYEAQEIDDHDHYNLSQHYECVQIVSDGTQWRVISKK